jgi:hypothetical protein
MRQFLLCFLGACYVALAVVSAFPTIQSDHAATTKPSLVEQGVNLAAQCPRSGWSASDFTIEVWGTPTCYYCDLLKREFKTLRGYGYKVIYREDKAPRRFTRHPTSVITYVVNGKRVKLMDIIGYFAAPEFHVRIMKKAMELDPCSS